MAVKVMYFDGLPVGVTLHLGTVVIIGTKAPEEEEEKEEKESA
jgi:hypothetical protein